MSIILIQQYYIPSDSKRLEELNKCLEFNINNPEINEIHLLNEKIYDYDILKNSKIKQISIGKRLTFKYAFDYGNSLGKDTIKILSNNDISFNEDSLKLVKHLDLENKCFALTRYDIVRYKPFIFNLELAWVGKENMSCCQDTWMFTYLKTSNEMDFCLGILGCDNYIAYLLCKQGINVLNKCYTIHTYHHHLSNIRTYSRNKRVGNKKMYKYLEFMM